MRILLCGCHCLACWLAALGCANARLGVTLHTPKLQNFYDQFNFLHDCVSCQLNDYGSVKRLNCNHYSMINVWRKPTFSIRYLIKKTMHQYIGAWFVVLFTWISSRANYFFSTNSPSSPRIYGVLGVNSPSL